MKQKQQGRRNLMRAIVTLVAGAMIPLSGAQAADPVKVGLMLPATGTFAALGTAITNGFKQYVDEQGGTLAGREIQYFTVDDESDPSKATENANRLVVRDRMDVLVGTVHSGVALHRAQRGCRRPDPQSVCPQHAAIVLLQLAAGLRNGQGRGRARCEACSDPDMELRGRPGGRGGVQGGVCRRRW